MTAIILPAQTLADTGFSIDNSCRFEDGDSAYLSRTSGHGTPTNARQCTQSFWVKRGNITTESSIGMSNHVDANNRVSSLFTSDSIQVFGKVGGTAGKPSLVTTAKYRDPSAWYHIVIVFDASQGTAANRVKIYVNNVQQTSFSTETYPDQDTDIPLITGTNMNIGRRYNGGYLDPYEGYMAEFHYIEGQALTPSSFAEDGDYGEWKAIEYSGSYGENGFYLDFSDSAALGDDAAGSNDFTVTNITASDQVKDSPTNNWCALNPLQKDAQGSSHTYSEGNLKVVEAGGGGYWRESFGTFEVPKTDKWYMEFYHVTVYAHIGLMSGSDAVKVNDAIQTGHVWYDYDTQQGGSLNYNNSTQTTGGTGANEVFAISVDAGVVKMYKSNVLQHTFSQNLSTAGSNAVMPIVQMNAGATWVANFGQDHTFAGNKSGGANAQDSEGFGSFYYSPPAEHKALCSKNLTDCAVTPSEHFTPVIYNGNGSTQTITTGFQPDLVWTKGRGVAWDHQLVDSVRGATYYLSSQDTAVEGQFTDGVTGFVSTGYTLGARNKYNTSSNTYVSWNWKAGTDQGSTATSGSGTNKTYTASYNVDAGFSIVAFTGNGTAGHTIPHHLGAKPDLMMIKQRNEVSSWCVYADVATMGAEKFNELHATSALQDSTVWNDTEPTTSVFSVGAGSDTNINDATYVVYLWRSIEGYSKIGSYTGNQNDDGAFVYCGFRPAYILIKTINGTEDWQIIDSARDPYNEGGTRLKANDSVTESLVVETNFLSNGFKNTYGAEQNSSSYNYLYMAFAETPFKNANAR